MTEQEAKTKWCPHAVASHTDPRAGFREGGGPPVFPCIASACMAWRWYRVYSSDPAAGALADMVDTGYCGLAGTP